MNCDHRITMRILPLILGFILVDIAAFEANVYPMKLQQPNKSFRAKKRMEFREKLFEKPANSYQKYQKTSPFLYFSANEVTTMQQKAATTHHKISVLITAAGKSLVNNPSLNLPPVEQSKFDSRWNEIYGNNLCAFAMYYVLNPRDKEAIDLLKIYMDRMANYTDWYVASSRNIDEVPVAHSLTGFATAFDFLYVYLEPSRRELYINKIIKETRNLYELMHVGRVGWTRQYIHNHAPTNIIAILLGGLLAENFGVEESKFWLLKARDNLDKAMTILANVVDGSLDEGVAYGSYTARGITMYVFLAKRHFNVDHTNNPWLKEHFWFYFSTTLPGYQRSIGIADSNYNWFYGPESQLVFLDKYIMKNGYGNWLADRIRDAKPLNKPLARARSQKWTTLHTEFIFYDDKLGSNKPLIPMNSSLHLFSDWGVVTYGGGLKQAKGNTFLSLKSGSINGEAVRDIINYRLYSKWIDGWKNFNAGHEHPDQNSFVFVPNGRYFINEGLYSPKFSYLNNVLLFSPSAESQCNQPWQGQIGECSKWLKYNQEIIPRGEIVASSKTGGMVLMAGESVDAYPKDLLLQSVFRSLLLINPEVLVVFDNVQFMKGSTVKKFSAMFINTLHKFLPHKQVGLHGAKIAYPEGLYKMFWLASDGQSPEAAMKAFDYGGEAGSRTANSLNVTYNVKSRNIAVAYIFHGPTYSVQSAWFHQVGESKNMISVLVDGKLYKIKFGLDSRVNDIKQTTAYMRKQTTGYGGFATVEVDNDMYYFGVGSERGDETEEPNNADKSKFQSNHNLFYTESKKLVNIRRIMSDWNYNRGDDITVHNIKSNEFSRFGSPLMYLLICFFVLTFVIVYAMHKRTRSLSKYFNNYGHFAVVLLILWMVMISVQFICSNNMQCFTEGHSKSNSDKSDRISMDNFSFPFVVISQLPSSGSDIMETVFDNLTDYLYIPVGENELTIPVTGKYSNNFDFNHWEKNSNDISIGWFLSLQKLTKVHFNNQPSSTRVSKIKRLIRQNLNSMKIVNLLSGFWTSKLSWINNALGSKAARFIIVVKDPRTWIHELRCKSLQRENRSEKSTMEELLHVYEETQELKLENYEEEPDEYRTLKWRLNNKQLTKLQKLAALWTVNVLSSLKQAYADILLRNIQVVKIEDFYSHPEKTTRSIFARLGLTVPAPQINRVVRFTKREEILNSDMVEKNEIRTCLPLSIDDIKDIEKIAGTTMELLNYKTIS